MKHAHWRALDALSQSSPKNLDAIGWTRLILHAEWSIEHEPERADFWRARLGYYQGVRPAMPLLDEARLSDQWANDLLGALSYALPCDAEETLQQAAALRGQSDLSAEEHVLLAQADAINGRNPERLLRLLHARLTPTLRRQVLEATKMTADFWKQDAYKVMVMADLVMRVMVGELVRGEGEQAGELVRKKEDAEQMDASATPAVPVIDFTTACDWVARALGLTGRRVAQILSLQEYSGLARWEAFKKKYVLKAPPEPTQHDQCYRRWATTKF